MITITVEDRRHPEKREGEIYLTNTDPGDYEKIGWRTKRLGLIAYSLDGHAIDSLRPVFVSRAELTKAGFTITENSNEQHQQR